MVEYSLSVYRDDFFRVVRRSVRSSPSVYLGDEHASYDGKLDCALARARTVVRELALCSDWEWFCTLTFDRRKVRSRWDLKGLVVVLMQWLQNMRKRYYPTLRYLLIPEQHKSGAWHFHGLFSGIPCSDLPWFAPRRLIRNGFLEWTDCRLRFGWCSFAPLKNPIAAAFYVSKYITKSLADSAAMKGVHTHYQSRGLPRSLPLGSRFSSCPVLDACCKNHNAFCSAGFFRLKNIGAFHFESLVDLCDEVSPMFESYLIGDAVPGLPVLLAGGDDVEEYVQLALESFGRSGDSPVGLSPWDLPPDCSRFGL